MEQQTKENITVYSLLAKEFDRKFQILRHKFHKSSDDKIEATYKNLTEKEIVRLKKLFYFIGSHKKKNDYLDLMDILELLNQQLMEIYNNTVKIERIKLKNKTKEKENGKQYGNKDNRRGSNNNRKGVKVNSSSTVCKQQGSSSD